MDQTHLSQPPPKLNPRQLNSRRNYKSQFLQLLLACEKQVREAKGYVVEGSIPLEIRRVLPGEKVPPHATFLSRPKNTGVDFTVPVKGSGYNVIVRNPIWLNLIREKIKKGEYMDSEGFLDDMRLLATNTALYNKDPGVGWVVEHARLLLEVAEESVGKRKEEFYLVEQGMRWQEEKKREEKRDWGITTSSSAGLVSPGGGIGKRKRGGGGGGGRMGVGGVDGYMGGGVNVNGNVGKVRVGSLLDVLWEANGKWYAAKVVKMRGTKSVQVIYFDDNTGETLNLNKTTWRFSQGDAVGAVSSSVGQGGGRRRKGGTVGANALGGVGVGVGGGVGLGGGGGDSLGNDVVTRQDLDDMRAEIMGKLNEMHLVLLNEIRYAYRRFGETLLDPDRAKKLEQTIKKTRRHVISEVHELHGLVTGDGPPKRPMRGDDELSEDGDEPRNSGSNRSHRGKRKTGEDTNMDGGRTTENRIEADAIEIDDDDESNRMAAKKRFEVAADLGFDSDMDDDIDGALTNGTRSKRESTDTDKQQQSPAQVESPRKTANGLKNERKHEENATRETTERRVSEDQHEEIVTEAPPQQAENAVVEEDTAVNSTDADTRREDEKGQTEPEYQEEAEQVEQDGDGETREVMEGEVVNDGTAEGDHNEEGYEEIDESELEVVEVVDAKSKAVDDEDDHAMEVESQAEDDTRQGSRRHVPQSADDGT